MSEVTSDDVLLITRPEKGIAVLTLNRPKVLNALNIELRKALAAAVDELDADESVRVIVVKGSAKAFCAGADLQEFVDANSLEIIGRNTDRIWGAVARCRKPMIAAVRGYAFGGGSELAMHADIIVASKTASFGQPEIKVGIMPGGGAAQRLTRAVGKFRAMKILLTGDAVTGEEAAQMGWVSEAVDDAEVDERAMALARQLVTMPQMALRFIKEAVLSSMSMNLEEALQMERKSFALLFETKDKVEGMRARLDKRPAVFD